MQISEDWRNGHIVSRKHHVTLADVEISMKLWYTGAIA